MTEWFSSMEWNNIRIVINGKSFDASAISEGSGASIKVSLEEVHAMQQLLPHARMESLTSAFFYPVQVVDPMDWLLGWCRNNGLRLISEEPLAFEDKWLVHFGGDFPSADVPSAIVPVSITGFEETSFNAVQ